MLLSNCSTGASLVDVDWTIEMAREWLSVGVTEHTQLLQFLKIQQQQKLPKLSSLYYYTSIVVFKYHINDINEDFKKIKLDY